MQVKNKKVPNLRKNIAKFEIKWYKYYNEIRKWGEKMEEAIPKISIVNTKALKITRVEEDKTQDDLAELLKISRGTYSKKENGIINMTIDEAVMIAEELQMDFNKFNKVFGNGRLKKEKLEYIGHK